MKGPATMCPLCGCNPEERSGLLKIAVRASDLIHEGRQEDNLDNIVVATDALMTELRDFVETFGELYDEVQ